VNAPKRSPIIARPIRIKAPASSPILHPVLKGHPIGIARIGDLLILDRHPVDPRESDEPIHSSHSLYPSGYLPFLPVRKCFRAQKERTGECGFNSIRLSRALRKGAPYLHLPTVTTTRRKRYARIVAIDSISKQEARIAVRIVHTHITSLSDDDLRQLPEIFARRFRDTK